VSRILFPASGAATIHLGHPLLGASSSYLRTGRAACVRRPPPMAGALALLPVGFTWPPASPQMPVRSYRTLSPWPRHRGGLLSVALSRGSLRVAVSNHRALWSPDFPRPAPSPYLGGSQRRGRPAGSFAWYSIRFRPVGTEFSGHRSRMLTPGCLLLESVAGIGTADI